MFKRIAVAVLITIRLITTILITNKCNIYCLLCANASWILKFYHTYWLESSCSHRQSCRRSHKNFYKLIILNLYGNWSLHETVMCECVFIMFVLLLISTSVLGDDNLPLPVVRAVFSIKIRVPGIYVIN